MTATEILEKIITPLLAACMGAFLAFRYQNTNEKRKNKMYVLGALMAHRHNGASEDEFVKALNLIDIVFHDNKKVKELLHKYLDVTRGNLFTPGERINVFFELLVAMGQDIGYKDLKRTDVNDFYSPLPMQEPPPNTTPAP